MMERELTVANSAPSYDHKYIDLNCLLQRERRHLFDKNKCDNNTDYIDKFCFSPGTNFMDSLPKYLNKLYLIDFKLVEIIKIFYFKYAF